MDRQSDPAYDWQDDLEMLKRRACVGRNDIVYDSAAVSTSGKTLKYNEHKVRLSLVAPFFINELAKVFEYGLSKYEEGSWKEFDLDDAIALIDPAMRHTDQYRDGEYYDLESKLPHLMQAAWNLMVIHYHIQKGQGDASVPDLR